MKPWAANIKCQRDVLHKDKGRGSTFVSVGGSHETRQANQLLSQQEVINTEWKHMTIKWILMWHIYNLVADDIHIAIKKKNIFAIQ